MSSPILLPSPNHTRLPNRHPSLIVLHYTASGDARSSAEWLCTPAARASAHYVVGQGGEVYRLVEEADVAWHAGKGSWKGKSDVNRQSIGIEQVNWGVLLYRRKLWRTWLTDPRQGAGGWWKVYQGSPPGMAPPPTGWAPTGLVGPPAEQVGWEPWSPILLASTEQLIEAIAERWNIPGSGVVGHSDVAPGRKIDPGPLYPMQRMRAAADRGAARHQGR